MEPILDETSLVPCPSWRPAARVLGLARTLQALDGLGAPRVLRAVREAADRDTQQVLGAILDTIERVKVPAADTAASNPANRPPAAP